MALTTRPFRSVLYIPGSKERALDKARTLPVDAIIFDLEDAVAVDEKKAAREMLAHTLRTADYGPRTRIVRINGLDTAWGSEDLAALAGAGADAILLPKVGSPSDLDVAGTLAPDQPLWAMMETPKGILNAAEIAAHPRLQGMVMGTNDLAKDLRSRSRAALTTSLQLCLLAARAHGLVIVDGVYNAFKDEDGLRAECAEGRGLGFDGKTLIHPAQIAAANEVFAPSEAEIDLARRQIAAYDEASAAGQGVAVVDGAIVENLHVATARATLAQADAIAELERAT
ncbi:HpcH/HpaI aldolase/citrate lyase family protein [Anianabacter salinae]|uniref:HpcH/HpaI aldolase/citrate lyase family protein n=1 Tax=Anianabacter salinae TaxID=2851023 RepID=UPI00225DD79C|nr:CoA ester lyase [Anianabacter salinae]MBV0913021.1 CoA ester lyase [Anianabacter salinae]